MELSSLNGFIFKEFEIDEAIAPLSVHQFVFQNEIYTRYLKIVPVDYTAACLKIEIIGCPRQGM